MSKGKSEEYEIDYANQPQLLGHPTGLYTLFFAEMWERFSYYGMRALLVFYMIKGFLSYTDGDAYTIYGAYTALVYMTPFFGGMIADRLIGARRAVILGGMLMAGGHLMMTIEEKNWFFMALAMLIVGNGFFKPNISTIVGTLYPPKSNKRDAGFTIFYIGINLGAAMAPLLCGYVGETFGWHKGFGLATVGMLTGLAVFIAPTIISQLLLFVSVAAATANLLEYEQLAAINAKWGFLGMQLPISLWIAIGTMVLAGTLAFMSLGKRQETGKLESGGFSRFLTVLMVLAGAGGIAAAMIKYHPENSFTTIVFYLMAVVLMISALVSCVAILKSGLPGNAGLPPSLETLREKKFGLTNEWLVYVGAIIAVPIFMLFVSGFEPLFGEKGGVRLIPESVVENLEFSNNPAMQILATVVGEMSRPAGLMLMLAGLGALFYLFKNIFSLTSVERQRMYVVMILTFFSMLFWSFFEQAGSSVNNFTDRNVDRVVDEELVVTEDNLSDEAKRLRIPIDTTDEGLKEFPVLTQEFLGYENANPEMTERIVKAIRLVERVKIEKREKDKEYAADVDAAKDQLISSIWDQVRPVDEPEAEKDADADADADAEHAEVVKTPEEKKAEKEADKQWKDDLKAKIAAAVDASSVLNSDDEAKKKELLGQLLDRTLAEKTVDAVKKDQRLTMTGLTYLREYATNPVINATTDEKIIDWQYSKQNIGMSVGGSEVPASVFQSVNPILILIFGLVFSLLWGYLSSKGMEPSTPVKFALGLIQLGLGFACFWWGATTANSEGMVALIWLFAGYLFQTTGELCLSPVGLSMVTKLSPKHLVSTVMGTWFLATAFSQFLAAIIAQFTGVSHGGGGGTIPVPTETVDVYGGVFKIIAISAIVSGVICLVMAPVLKKWMHEDKD